MTKSHFDFVTRIDIAPHRGKPSGLTKFYPLPKPAPLVSILPSFHYGNLTSVRQV